MAHSTVPTQGHTALDSPPGDAELISAVRGGDTEAYGVLFERHRVAATRLAQTLLPGPDADDLVSEAFIKVLRVLQQGSGPDLAFRAYLLTAIRRLHIDRTRAVKRTTPTDDFSGIEPGVPFIDPAVAGFESGAAARAFRSLPERWQTVLWHVEVEGQRPAEVAPLLGMSANAVSALAYRAREGLRQAFLQMHAADEGGETCQAVRDQLGSYVRRGLSRRDSDKVERHLDECRKCMAIYLELAEVNSSLSGILGPLVLGSASLTYLSGATVTGASGGAAASGGLIAALNRTREFLSGNATGVIATAAAASLAVAGGVTAAQVRQAMTSPTVSVSALPDRPTPSLTPVARAVAPAPVSRPAPPLTAAPSAPPPSRSLTPAPSSVTPLTAGDTGVAPSDPGAGAPASPGHGPRNGTGPGTDGGTDPGTDGGGDTDPGPGPDPGPPVGVDLSPHIQYNGMSQTVTVSVNQLPANARVNVTVTAQEHKFDATAMLVGCTVAADPSTVMCPVGDVAGLQGPITYPEYSQHFPVIATIAPEYTVNGKTFKDKDPSNNKATYLPATG